MSLRYDNIIARMRNGRADPKRARAQYLRRQGYTYTEICDRLGRIPQGTLSYWLKDIHLNRTQRARIQAKIIASAARGRPLARKAWIKKMAKWRQHIEARAKPLELLPYENSAIGKIVCGIMYLCEGGKYPASQHVTFGNTDQTTIRGFLVLLRRYYPIDERRLRVRVTHRWDQDGMALKRYWARVTKIPVRQFYPSYADKRTKGIATQKHNYRGVCCIHYGSTDIQYELQATGEAIMKASHMAAGKNWWSRRGSNP